MRVKAVQLGVRTYEREHFRSRWLYRYHVTWPASNAKFTFCVGQNQNTRTYLKAHDTWLLGLNRFPKQFFLPTPHYICFGNKWVKNPIFLLPAVLGDECKPSSSHIIYISILGLHNRSLQPNICAAFLRRLTLQCFSLSIILTSSLTVSHKNYNFRNLHKYIQLFGEFLSENIHCKMFDLMRLILYEIIVFCVLII